MSRIRKIRRGLIEGRNYFLLDANFLVNKFIPPPLAPNDHQRRRIEKCLDWWAELDQQLTSNKARLFVPDLCIAEAYKVLAQKYYLEKWFKTSSAYSIAKKGLTRQVTTSAKELAKYDRKIICHDISTSRDLIISVDRFFEVFMKRRLPVSLPDLIILATAKYLVDFYDVQTKRIHIITLDKNLRSGAKYIAELPYVYNPTEPQDAINRVFIG